jgi:glucose-6-phosphate-specific signal transduction histidine kinase
LNQQISRRPRDSANRSGNDEVLAQIQAVGQDLHEHDRYVRENIAKEMTVGQLIQAIQTQLRVVPGGRSANLEQMKRIALPRLICYWARVVASQLVQPLAPRRHDVTDQCGGAARVG